MRSIGMLDPVGVQKSILCKLAVKFFFVNIIVKLLQEYVILVLKGVLNPVFSASENIFVLH